MDSFDKEIDDLEKQIQQNSDPQKIEAVNVEKPEEIKIQEEEDKEEKKGRSAGAHDKTKKESKIKVKKSKKSK